MSWRISQMVDQLCARGGASSSDLDSAAPVYARGGVTTRAATAPSAPQAAGAFFTAGRMARLAALYGGGASDAVGGPPASFDELRVQVAYAPMLAPPDSWPGSGKKGSRARAQARAYA